jgi:hypothetical protein
LGQGIVRALLETTEYLIVALVREGSNIQPQERDDHRLIVLPAIDANGTMESVVEKLKEAIGERPIDHVVSCFGGASPRRTLSAMDDTDVLASAERALPHHRLLKAVAPLVRNDPRSSYTFITGMLGERCFMPEKLTGMTLSNGLLYSMIVAFRSEQKAAGNSFRIGELRIGSMLHKDNQEIEKEERVRSHPAIPSSTAMESFPSDLVGRIVIDVAEGRGRDQDIIRLQDEQFRELIACHGALFR